MFHSGSRIMSNTTSVYQVEAYSGFMLSGLLVRESVACLGSGGVVGSGAVVGAATACVAGSAGGGGVPQPLRAMLTVTSTDRTIQDHLRIFSSLIWVGKMERFHSVYRLVLA